MKNILAEAFICMKKAQPLLILHGSIVTYKADDKVTLKEPPSPGINPDIFDLDLHILEGTGPRKGTPKDFSFCLSEVRLLGYSKICIRSGDDILLTVNIKIL